MKKGSRESMAMAAAVALGPVLILVGLVLFGAWVADREQARARAKEFMSSVKAANMHVEDQEFALAKFEADDPEAAKFIKRSKSGLGIRMV